MTIQMDLWQLVVLIIAIVFAFWLLTRHAVRQTKASIAQQFSQVTDHLNSQDTELQALQTKVHGIELDLAQNYVKRPDHVRDIGTLRVQFAALANSVEHKLDDQTRKLLMMLQRIRK